MNNTPSLDAINNYILTTKAKSTKVLDKIRLRCFCKYAFDNGDFLTADWSKLKRECILRFIEYKKDTAQFDTVNGYLTTLKMLANSCYEHEAINQKEYYLIKAIKPYKGFSADKGRALSLKEVNKVKAHFFNVKNASQCRNFAIFALGIGCGLRRAEISALNIEDITGRKIHVTGKGNKARITYLPDIAQKAVNQWLNQLTKKKGALFTHITRGDKIKTDRLGIKGIHYIINGIQEKCKLS